MANDQGARYGAFPVYNPQSPPVLLYYKVETSATIDMFRGQFVQINSRGNAQVYSQAGSGGILGVAWEFLDSNLAGLPSSMTKLDQGAYLPKATDGYVGVSIDPNQLYLMEESTGGTALSANSIGCFIDFTYLATSGNTNTGWANTVLKQASLITSGTTAPLQLLNVYNIINQDGTINAAGDSCKWVVRVTKPQLAPVALGIIQG